jgi:tight adherence protein B
MIVVLFFIAVICGLITLYMWYAAVKASPTFELRRRLRKLAHETKMRIPEELRIEIFVDMTVLDKFLYKLKFIRKLDGLIDKAGIKLDLKMLLLIVLISAVSGLFIGIALQRGIIPPLILLLIGGSIPFFFLHYKKTRRIRLFTEGFPGALDMISRSLRAGHSFISAVQMVGNELPEPVAGLFKTVYEEQTLGLSIKDALVHMTERMDTMDLRFFVTAINVYREIGGNLSEILERLGMTIRERIKIRRQVKVYTAQARLSGYVLAGLPIFVAVFFWFTSPDYIEELVSVKAGWYIIGGVIVSQIIGFLVIRKIIDIKI